jgi:DNA-binding beta-propeller fold protein YncE
MKKQIALIVGMLLPILLMAFSGSSDPAAVGWRPPLGSVSPTPSVPATPSAEMTAEANAETPPTGEGSGAPPEPGIPRLVDQVYLGVPAGNGHAPYRVAVDSQRRRAYTLNQGLVASDRGNTISVLDLESRQVSHLIQLHNMRAGDWSTPDPLDLQVDPYRPRLYAVWGNRYSETVDSSLTVLDADTLTIVATLPGVEAVAVGPERLYLANDERLWSVDPDSLAERDTRALEPRIFNQPLLISPEGTRLYLGRGNPASLDVFEADSLSPIGSYTAADRLIQAVVDPQAGRVYSLESDGQQVLLRALDADGQPLPGQAAAPLGDQVYSEFPLALDGQTLYVAGADYPNYRLDAFALPNLSRLDSLPLPAQPYDLAVDQATGFVYAAYSSWSDYVLAIDPGDGATETIYTAVALSDALADAGSGRLYVLDDSGRLRVLSLSGHSQVAEADTGYNLLEGRYTGYGRLSLDPSRERLYIGSDPVRIVRTDSLEVTASLEGRGQVTADPGGERLYLTPPCNCRVEQCNTLILDAETLTGTRRLFPPQDPMTAPCVMATQLDAENQLLYAQIYNGTPGSNSGDYYSVFDVGDRPRQIFSAFDISFGPAAIDPVRARAFVPRYRINRAFIHRFEKLGQSMT